MRRLTCIRERERGAVAMIVAMLFGFGVMLGLAALTIDVGNINADRRQLQNGADAVALAVAQQCVQDGTCKLIDPTTSKLYTNLQDLANANAADGATAIRRVDGVPPFGMASGTPAICGTADGLPKCLVGWAPSKSNLQECPEPTTPLSDVVKYVRVYTETDMKKADGTHDNILPYYFGAAITGISGANQQTCAQVGIGPMGNSTNTLPIVVAQCAYDTMLAANTPSFPPMPPNPGASVTLKPVPTFPTKGGIPEKPVEYSKYVMTMWSHISGGAHGPSKCTSTSPSGQYLPGGFGWTTTPDGTTCAVDFNSDTGTVPIDKGGDTPTGCQSVSGNTFDSFVGTTVRIPIMTGETTDGNNYNISGFAGFYVAGYNAPSGKPKSNDGYTGTGAVSLSGGDNGFWGWFTNEPVKWGSWGTSTDPTVPKLIGTIG